jgi:ribosome-associated protein
LENIVKTACRALFAKRGKNVAALDISGVSTIADYFVIVSAGSPPQARALMQSAVSELGKAGVFLKHTEGSPESPWYLLDFGALIIHIFTQADRAFYDLERVWADAVKLSVAEEACE